MTLKQKLFNKEHWKKGNGTVLLGVFIMLIGMFIAIMFVQNFVIAQRSLDTQTVADTIADSTAVYMMNEGEDYADAVNKANEIKNLVRATTGVDVTSVSIDQNELDENNTVKVNVDNQTAYLSKLHPGNEGSYSIGKSAATMYSRLAGNTDWTRWMIGIAEDPKVGYSQVRRSLNPDVDCSSFVYFALQGAGYDVGSYPFSTSTMGPILRRIGFQWLPFSSGLELQDGDILWKPGHTEVYIGNNQRVGAHSDENGGITGAISGDQTGREVSVETMHSNWSGVYRAPR